MILPTECDQYGSFSYVLVPGAGGRNGATTKKRLDKKNMEMMTFGI